MVWFVPRRVFPTLDNLPRSYFLGHHKKGLDNMKILLSSINVVVECRDYRIPLSSRNPLFESSLTGRERLIVHTKQDLGSEDHPEDREVSSSLSPDCTNAEDVVAYSENGSFADGIIQPPWLSRTRTIKKLSSK